MDRRLIPLAAVLLVLCSCMPGARSGSQADLLPGSGLSAPEAVPDAECAVAAVIEVLEESPTGEPGTGGAIRQKVRFAELILGGYEPRDAFDLVYTVDAGERPVRVGEPAIWLLRRLEPTWDGPSHEGLKALPDTPANRTLFINAINARLSERGSDRRAEVERLREQIEETDDPQARTALKVELGNALREIWWYERAWSHPPRGGKADPVQLGVHAARAHEARRQAVDVAREACGELRAGRPAPETLYSFGTLCEHLGMHAECAGACRALLALHADATVPIAGTERYHANVCDRLGKALAALGRREEAVDAFVDSMLSEEDESSRKRATITLLRYEPRLMMPEFRANLPEAALEALRKAEEQAGVLVRLSTETVQVAPGEPIEIDYRVTCREELPAGGWSYHLVMLSFPEGPGAEPGVLEGDSPGRRLSQPNDLPFRDGPEVDGCFTIRRGLPEGRYVITCTVDRSTFASFPQSPVVPAICWVEPAKVTVAPRHEDVDSAAVGPPAP